jgi:hypothetical protein
VKNNELEEDLQNQQQKPPVRKRRKKKTKIGRKTVKKERDDQFKRSYEL